MKGQTVRIESIRQEEFLWQSTAIWEQWLEPKKGRLFRYLLTKEESPKPDRKRRESKKSKKVKEKEKVQSEKKKSTKQKVKR